MKRIILVLMCALMLVSVTACEDKVRDKEDKKTEETKKPQDFDEDEANTNNSGAGETVFEELGLFDTSLHVFDGADLLTEAQEDMLNRDCENYSSLYKSDIVIVTVDEYEGDVEYAYKDIERVRYGAVDEESTDILFISMSTRDVWINSSEGKNGRYINNSQCDEICDEIIPYLSHGNYHDAFNKYLDMLNDFYK